MIRLQPVLLVAIFTCLFSNTQSQSFGDNPGNIKWRQVNTGSARIIYPSGLDSVANRIATITELLGKDYSATIGDQHRKINVVLQANNTLSNAYVGLAPWRSEFYLTTPQNPFELGSMKWIDNLSVHEYRHVEQYSNFNHGLSKAFSILFGEGGQALANALSIPDWFFEGDAVWNETAFSQQGRGRLPEFFNAYKSLYYSDKDYSFMKLRNGSYRDYVPNHYDLGYLMVTYGREKYGDSIWRKITSDAAGFKGVFYPMQKAVKKYTGVEYSRFTKNAINYFQDQWKAEANAPNESAVNWITRPEKHQVVNYKYPYPAADSGIMLLKKGNRQIPTFILMDNNGNEKKIAVKEISYDDYYSYKNGRIIYTALKPDARWGNRDYTVIRLLDINTKKVKSIATKAKYFSPDISEDGQRIVVVEADPAKTGVLQLLSVDGKILKSWTADSSLFYSHPKFIDDKNVIVAARQKDGQMGWIVWHIESSEGSWLLKPSKQVIGFPVIQHDSLFYTGTVGKTDGLFVIDIAKKSAPVLVANYRTGIYQGFEKDGKITGVSFTAEGYRPGVFEPLSIVSGKNELMDLYVPETIADKPDISDINTNNYVSKKYSKAFRPLNFHSWQPEISDPDYLFRLLGENVLSTFYSEVYYNYNRNENSNRIGIAETFGGWYVEPYVSISQTWGRAVQLNADTTLVYNQTNAGFGLQLPLNLSFGKAYRYLTLSSSFNNEQVKWRGFAKDLYNDENFNSINARLVYTVQIQKAQQHIYPRYAESFVAEYNRSISADVEAWQWLLSGSLYLPGLSVNHNLVLTAAYQIRDTMQQYFFTNSFPFSRGYNDVNFPKMLRLGANYHLPLFYPDWGFGQMLYFQRIRMNVFYDYTRGTSIRTGISYPFSTVGSEFFFDTKWWNQLPVTFGFRYSRLLDHEYRGATNPNQWEFILPINLLPR